MVTQASSTSSTMPVGMPQSESGIPSRLFCLSFPGRGVTVTIPTVGDTKGYRLLADPDGPGAEAGKTRLMLDSAGGMP